MNMHRANTNLDHLRTSTDHIRVSEPRHRSLAYRLQRNWRELPRGRRDLIFKIFVSSTVCVLAILAALIIAGGL